MICSTHSDGEPHNFACRKHEHHSEKAGQGGEGAQPVSLFSVLGYIDLE